LASDAKVSALLLLFSFAVALPFACLALVSLISFLAIMAIGGVIHALRAVQTPIRHT